MMSRALRMVHKSCSGMCSSLQEILHPCRSAHTALNMGLKGFHRAHKTEADINITLNINRLFGQTVVFMQMHANKMACGPTSARTQKEELFGVWNMFGLVWCTRECILSWCFYLPKNCWFDKSKSQGTCI